MTGQAQEVSSPSGDAVPQHVVQSAEEEADGNWDHLTVHRLSDTF